MFGKKKKNAIAYGIIGLGRFGEALATELARSGAELLGRAAAYAQRTACGRAG